MKIEIVNQYSLLLTQVKNLSLNLFRLYNAMQQARKAETALQQALADMQQMRSGIHCVTTHLGLILLKVCSLFLQSRNAESCRWQ